MGFHLRANGRVLRRPTIIIDAPHAAVAIEVDRTTSGIDVARVLDRLALSPGRTHAVLSDNDKVL